jgi:hypothetical protein
MYKYVCVCVCVCGVHTDCSDVFSSTSPAPHTDARSKPARVISSGGGAYGGKWARLGGDACRQSFVLVSFGRCGCGWTIAVREGGRVG